MWHGGEAWRTGQEKRNEERDKKEKRHTSTHWKRSLYTSESQSETKCKEVFALPSESHMCLSEVVFFLVMDRVLHALPDEVKPNYRCRVVGLKYVPIFRASETIEL